MVDNYAALLDTWEVDNSKVITWINNYVTPSIGVELAKYDFVKQRPSQPNNGVAAPSLDPSLLEQFQKFLAFQSQALATSSGNSLSSLDVESISTPFVSLFDVYYIPSFTMNISFFGVKGFPGKGSTDFGGDQDRHREGGLCLGYMTRLVAKGYDRESGMDYEETFAPVAKMTTCWVYTFSLYVGDMIITRGGYVGIESLKLELAHLFAIKDFRLLRYFLGIEVAFLSKGYILSQSKYIGDLLDRARITNKMVEDIPIDAKAKYTSTDGDPLPDPSLC
nr:uncharacterized mitochondrial protein AtMg00810-like [Tanacetum cinerariifolium]